MIGKDAGVAADKVSAFIAGLPVNLDNSRQQVAHDVANHPPQKFLVGLSAGAWGRGPGENGRVAYFLTNGGAKSPPGDGPQTAKFLRIEFGSADGAGG